MDNEIGRKIDVVTAMQFLLVQNRQQIQDWILIGSGANWLGILDRVRLLFLFTVSLQPDGENFTIAERNIIKYQKIRVCDKCSVPLQVFFHYQK